MGTRLGEVVEGIGQTNTAQQTPYEAIIANTVTAFGQDLFALIPSIDGGQTTKGPLRWTPLPGQGGSLIYPTKGDLAQVVRTNEGFYWLTAFVPATWPSVDQLTVRKFSPVGVSSQNLGSISGQSITAVRLTGQLVTASTGGNTFIRLRPNGLNPISTSVIDNEVNWANGGPSGAATPRFASNFVNAAGMVIAPTDWAVASNEVYFEGTFFTNLPAGLGFLLRQWIGRYKNHDLINNRQNYMSGSLSSMWGDVSTLLTSLVLVIDAGNFSGRITMEVIP